MLTNTPPTRVKPWSLLLKLTSYRRAPRVHADNKLINRIFVAAFKRDSAFRDLQAAKQFLWSIFDKRKHSRGYQSRRGCRCDKCKRSIRSMSLGGQWWINAWASDLEVNGDYEWHWIRLFEHMSILELVHLTRKHKRTYIHRMLGRQICST